MKFCILLTYVNYPSQSTSSQMCIVKNLNTLEYFNHSVKLKKPYASKILYEQTISQVFIWALYFVRLVALLFDELWCIGQVLNMRNIFLKNLTQNVVEKLVPDPFLKIKIGHISGSIIQSFVNLSQLYFY